MDLMNQVFKPYPDKFVVVFMDDVLGYSISKEGYAEHLCIVLKALEEYKLYAKFKKCDFWMEKVHFVRPVISKEGVYVDLAEVEAVVNWLRRINITKVWSFLGMAGYCQTFIEGFSKLAL